MPIFNAADYLTETLTSLTKQKYENWELLAVDDGSTDGSRELLKSFQGQFPGRVHLLSSPNLGPSGARNLGVQRARGAWIALCDADDVWKPNKLSRQIGFLERSEQMSACSCAYFLGTRATDPVIEFDWSPQAMASWALLEGYGPALCSTLVIRTSVYWELGGFDPKMTVAEDTEFALRLSRTGRVGTLREPLVSYRKPGLGKHALRISATQQGVESLLEDPFFNSNPNLSRRLRSNVCTLLAMRLLFQVKPLQSSHYWRKALLHSPISSLRYVALTLRRKSSHLSRKRQP